MLSESMKEILPERIYQRINKVNADTLRRIGERVEKIGRLSAGDRQKLEQLKMFGSDVDAITAELAEATNKNTADIYAIYEAAAKENYKFSERFYNAAGVKYIPYAANKALQDFVKAQAKITAGENVNLSRTTAFLREINGKKQLTSLAETYQSVIDEAVTAVSMGVTDYHSSMRKSMRELADSGLRTKYTPLKNAAGKAVDYPTGYSRRLDTAARQNILWGVKAINQDVADMTGKEFGADGYEIDYHSCPRPSHEAMGGQQYAIGYSRTVNGVYYPSFNSVAGLLDDYGCLHFKFSILLGVSEPAYDKGTRERLKASDRDTIEYEGKEYTKYEATQVQRKLETAARNAKDRQIIAKACGDDELRRQEQERINAIAYKYNDFSKQAGLPTKIERMRVSGYHKVLTNSGIAHDTSSGHCNIK